MDNCNTAPATTSDSGSVLNPITITQYRGAMGLFSLLFMGVGFVAGVYCQKRFKIAKTYGFDE